MSKKEMFKPEKKYITMPGMRDNDKIEDALILPDDMEVSKPYDPFASKVKEVEDYNEKISTDFSDFKHLNLIGPKILFRPFKVSPVTKGGIARSFSIKYQDPETQRVKTTTADFAVQYRGVVCLISDDCSSHFKGRVKVGDIVDINPIAWQQHSYYLNRDVFQETEEPFTFWLTEQLVQAKIENTKGS